MRLTYCEGSASGGGAGVGGLGCRGPGSRSGHGAASSNGALTAIAVGKQAKQAQPANASGRGLPFVTAAHCFLG
jgi:hypothetical protein